MEVGHIVPNVVPVPGTVVVVGTSWPESLQAVVQNFVDSFG